MANHKSAIKRHRQSIKRRSRNRMTRSMVRTAIKGVQELVAKGDLEGAKTSFRSAEKAIARAASKGMYHHKNASRKISRLAALISRASSK